MSIRLSDLLYAFVIELKSRLVHVSGNQSQVICQRGERTIGLRIKLLGLGPAQ